MLSDLAELKLTVPHIYTLIQYRFFPEASSGQATFTSTARYPECVCVCVCVCVRARASPPIPRERDHIDISTSWEPSTEFKTGLALASVRRSRVPLRSVV